MPTSQPLALMLMAAFYLFAGASHFLKPGFFLKIIPKWVPNPELTNLLVGAIEVLLGLGLLFGETRSVAAWGIIVLLVAVFPANIYHYQQAKAKNKMVIATLIRLPLQGLLIYWAYLFI